MANRAKSAWYGVAAAAIGTGVFLLATNKGRLFQKGKAGLQALVGGTPAGPAAPATPPAAPAPSSSDFKGRTPTPENGHVRDVVATNPPKPETGSNFTKHGDVHQPQGEEASR